MMFDLDAIRAATPISAVLEARGIALRRVAPGRWFAPCPAHAETTPSFHIDDAKGLGYCFGCGFGGDVFRVVMALDSVSFRVAAEALASAAGVAPGPADEARMEARRLESLAREDAERVARGVWQAQMARLDVLEQRIAALSARGCTPLVWDALGNLRVELGLVEDWLGCAVYRAKGWERLPGAIAPQSRARAA